MNVLRPAACVCVGTCAAAGALCRGSQARSYRMRRLGGGKPWGMRAHRPLKKELPVLIAAVFEASNYLKAKLHALRQLLISLVRFH